MKKNGRKKRKKISFVGSRNKRKLPHSLIIKKYWDWLKNNASLRFPTTRMLAPIFHVFCKIFNWFCLLCHILHQNNIYYTKFSNSNLQLPAYTAYRSLQKITNLMVRHLTRPYFLESCESEILLWHCYTTNEENKVSKIILAETDIETSNTFIGYAIWFKHKL